MRRTRPFSVTVVLSFVVLGGIACSSSSTGSPTGAGGDCASLAAAECDKTQSCSPFLIEASYGSVDACKTRLTALCQVGFQEPGIGAATTFIADCASGYSSASCDAMYSGVPVPGCAIPAGTFAAGHACADHAQCQSLFCNKTGASGCGTCAAAPKVGDACTSTCGLTLACTNGKCAAQVQYGGVGATCSAAAPCAGTLTCFNGQCARPSGAGQACGSTAPACDVLQGLMCQSGACAPIQIASAGQPCGLTGSSYVLCFGGATCKTPTGSTSGTCDTVAADGQACDATNGPRCMIGAACVNGTCMTSQASLCK